MCEVLGDSSGFLKQLYHFASPPAVCERSRWPTSLPALEPQVFFISVIPGVVVWSLVVAVFVFL